jgi:response regulator RpfG family c-di-GMP phosphodiesterase
MTDKKLVIVAIDDYKDNLIAVKAFVTDSFPGARVYTALNGKDGIELARSRYYQEYDRYVVLDICLINFHKNCLQVI